MSTEDSPVMNKALAWIAVLGIAAAFLGVIAWSYFRAHDYLAAPSFDDQRQYFEPHVMPEAEKERRRLKQEAYHLEILATTPPEFHPPAEPTP